jgi:hypothetical protein
MRLHTTSETVSFLKELEEKSARFYEDISQRFGKDENILATFARDNRKYVTQIERTYYSVITDALEGGYAFDLESDEFAFVTELPEGANYVNALAQAVELEEQTTLFYTVAAEQSMSLMADVPRNFKIVAKKRKNRIQVLKSLASK